MKTSLHMDENNPEKKKGTIIGIMSFHRQGFAWLSGGSYTGEEMAESMVSMRGSAALTQTVEKRLLTAPIFSGEKGTRLSV